MYNILYLDVIFLFYFLVTKIEYNIKLGWWGEFEKDRPIPT